MSTKKELQKEGDAIMRLRLGIAMPENFLDDVKVAANLADAFTEPSESASNGVGLATNELWEVVKEITGVNLKRRALEDKIRNLVARTNALKRIERMNEILAKLGRTRIDVDAEKEEIVEGEQLIRDKLLAPATDYQVLASRPLARAEVCRECNERQPETIWFRRLKPGEISDPPRRWKEREDSLRGLLAARLGKFELLAPPTNGISTEIVRHRGQCQGKDHDEIGRGHYDYPGILARVDFGNGLVIEREFEVE